MRFFAALFLTLHGIAHLIGFLTPWQLLTAGTATTAPVVATTLFGGRIELGARVARGLGLLWLALALGFAFVAMALWRHWSWWPLALGLVALASLVLTLVWWPKARVGVFVNLAILVALGTVAFRSYRRDIQDARQRMNVGATMLQSRCGNIEYASAGEGIPVLVLHGTGGGWDQGLESARGLIPHGYRLIAPSRFGYLRTPLPADASPGAEADTWACVLDALGVDRVAVMSFSAGTAPALQLALRHPDRVSSLVLFVPAAGGILPPQTKGPPPFVMNVVLRYDLPMWTMLRLFPNTMYNVVGVPPSYVASAPHAEVERINELMRMILPVSLRAQGMRIDARSQSGSEPIYPIGTITAPTLLLSAEDDLYRTLAVARHAVGVMPHARLIEFKTGGHLLLGRDAEIWPAVASFIAASTHTTDAASSRRAR